METKLKVIIGCIGVMFTGYLINHKHNNNLYEISKLKDENIKLNDKLKNKLDEENKYKQKIKKLYTNNKKLQKDLNKEQEQNKKYKYQQKLYKSFIKDKNLHNEFSDMLDTEIKKLQHNN